MKIRYIGVGAYNEQSVTGNFALWQPDQVSDVSTSDAAKLVATGGFIYDDESTWEGQQLATASEGIVTATTDPLTGRSSFLLPNAGRVALNDIENADAYPRIVAAGTDLTDWTTSSNGTAATYTVDTASPFGGSAIKCAIPTGNTNTDVGYQQLNINNFDDHVAFRIWIEDYSKINSIETFVASPAYALYTRYYYAVNAAEYAKTNGLHVIYAGPSFTEISGGTFVYGSTALGATKLRITSNAATNIWIQRIEVPNRQRPIASLIFDDGDSSWMTLVRPILNAYGIKATFAIMSSWLNDGIHLTTADVQTLLADGHQITSHNVTNSKYVTNQTLAQYYTDYMTCRKILEGIGVPASHMMYHSFVQGGVDQALITRMQSGGLRCGRNVNQQRINMYGSGLTANALNLNTISIGGTNTASMVGAVSNLSKYGGWLTMMGHEYIASGTPTGTQGLPANLEAVCVALKSANIPAVTVRDAYSYLLRSGFVSP